jgi:hypothetical protein
MNSFAETRPSAPGSSNSKGVSHAEEPISPLWRRSDTGPAPHAGNGNGASTTEEATEPPDGHVREALGSDDEIATESPVEQNDVPGLLHSEDRATTSGDVVHDALKGPEVGFKYEVAGLEKEARRLAHMWADSGLPRHDLERGEPISAEVVLSQRAGEIYAGWIRRVRHKVEAAVSVQRGLLDRALENGLRALDAYRQTEHTLHELSPRARAIEQVAGASEQPREAPPQERHLLPIVVEPAAAIAQQNDTETEATPGPLRLATRELRRSFWPLSIALVLAEFIGNAPVFTELLPLSTEVDQRVTAAFKNAETSEYLIGLQDVALRLLSSPEPVFLALMVVVFFLFLGHHLGSELRVIVALRVNPSEAAAEVVLRSRRQALVACTAAGLGVVIMLAVLFLIRTQVEPMATERLNAAKRQLAAAEVAIAQAQAANEDRDRLDELRDTKWRAEDEHDRRVARMDYAASISTANIAISGMNFVLVIVAALAGYFRRDFELPRATRVDLVAKAFVAAAPSPDPAADGLPQDSTASSDDERQGRGESEVLATARRLNELRQMLHTKHLELESSIAEGDRAFAAANQLLHCDPTAKWEGIVNRLACAIHLFRSENALARKLDPHDIKAFRQPPVFDLKAPDERPLRADVVDALNSTYQRLCALRNAASVMGLPGRASHRTSASQIPEVLA